jgi:hypothetical protein
MNQLEKAIIDGTRTAQKEYQKMTEGWWLSHGPESFIEHAVAIKVARIGFSVYPEASPKKIRLDLKAPPRGRPAKNLGQRFDIVVWYKTTNKIRAIIEIKRAWSIRSLRGDRTKVANFLRQKRGAHAGYLLAYTEAKGTRCETTLSRRLDYWADHFECTLAGKHIDPERDAAQWGWCIGLFRVKAR